MAEIKVNECKMWEILVRKHDLIGHMTSNEVYRLWKTHDGWRVCVNDSMSLSLPKEVIDILIKESVKEDLKE